MSVIVELEVAANDFELGRILDLVQGVRVELETMVPAGKSAVPLFWVYNADREQFRQRIKGHDDVQQATEIDVFEDRILYALEWTVANDSVLEAISDLGGYVLDGTGHADTWFFQIRFQSHDALSAFRDRLETANVGFDVVRIYNPTRPEAGPWFGLTPSQREALVLAVENGYYEIPRRCTTVDLAEELGISDQAVTERLRRAILNLSTNTLLASTDGEGS